MGNKISRDELMNKKAKEATKEELLLFKKMVDEKIEEIQNKKRDDQVTQMVEDHKKGRK